MQEENFIAEVLKKRLEKNRCVLLNNPQNLSLYIFCYTEEMIPKKNIEKNPRRIWSISKNYF